MREIKFRAWDKEEKRMLYGDDVVITYNEICFEDMKKEDCENAKGMRLWVKEQDDVIGVHDAVFMQYTGLKDKNGREIYEGDVVKGVFEFEYEIDEDLWKTTRENIVGEVVFQFGCFGVLFEGDCFKSLYEAILSKTEVIGNIHENPGLLEENND